MRIRVVTSAWFSRLWTFQEGVMAKLLYFQFQDGAVDGTTLFAEEMRVEDKKLTREYSPEHLVSTAPRSVIFKPGVVNPREGLMNVFEGLRWRATTKPRDEAICLATVLQIDLPWIMSFPESERYKAVLATQQNFRLGILFFQGPRLADYGYRWAPRSFMNNGIPIPLGFTPAYFTQFTSNDAGLCFNCSGLVLGPATMPASTNMFMLRIPMGRSRQVLYGSWQKLPSYFLSELTDLNEPVELALITEDTNLGQVQDAYTTVSIAALIVLLKKEQFVWFGRFICCVGVACSVAALRLIGVDESGDNDLGAAGIFDLGEAEIRSDGAWCVG
jgi:hypothetical protein